MWGQPTDIDQTEWSTTERERFWAECGSSLSPPILRRLQRTPADHGKVW